MTVRLKVMVAAGMLAFGWAALAQQAASGAGSSVTVEVPAQNAGKNPDKNSGAKTKGKKDKDAGAAPDAGVKAAPVRKTAVATPVTKQGQGAGKSVAAGAASPATAAMASSVTVEVGPANSASAKTKGKKTKPGATAQDAATVQGGAVPQTATGSAASSSASANASTAAPQSGRVVGKTQAASGKGTAAGDSPVQTVTVEVPPQASKSKGKKSKAVAGAPASAPGADELAKTPPSNAAGDAAAGIAGVSGSSIKAEAAKAEMVESEAVEVAAKNQPPPKKVAAGKKPKAGSKRGAAADAAPDDAVAVEATGQKVPAAGEVATSTTASTETVEVAEAGNAPLSARERAAAERAAAKKVVVEEPVEVPPQAVLDEHGKPVLNSLGDPLYSPGMIQRRDANGKLMVDEKGDPVMQMMSPKLNAERVERVKKEGAPRAMPLIITDGALLVDGLPGKVRLNYDIAQLNFLYLFVPGTGTVVVSNMPFPGGIREPRAFDGKKLTVKASGHVLTVESEVKMTSGRPLPAFVSVDHDFALRSRFPVMGYGTTRSAPYAWPASKTPTTVVASGSAPSVSKDLLPSMTEGQACPAGQVCGGTPATDATAETKPADGVVAADAKPVGEGDKAAEAVAAPVAEAPAVAAPAVAAPAVAADSEAKPAAASDAAPAAVEAVPVAAPPETKPEDKPAPQAESPAAPSL